MAKTICCPVRQVSGQLSKSGLERHDTKTMTAVAMVLSLVLRQKGSHRLLMEVPFEK